MQVNSPTSGDTLERSTSYLLLAALAISVGITLPRFGPGIPMSVDTTSHLYKILFLDNWLEQGILPFWSPDWYGGSPALLLYPPLGYYLVVGVAILGVDPLLAYKIVDAAFYGIAPIMVYFLGKEIGFTKGESALGALLFSVVPEVIENYLFFDRFPTVISIPIFCSFLITFHRALLGQKRLTNIVVSILMMSALILTHHLSALIAGMVAVIMILLSVGRVGFKIPVFTSIIVGVGTFAVASFWLVPFLLSINLFSANQFFNRNVVFPFLRFVYFGFDVTSYLLGIAQFVLAAIAVHSILRRTLAKGTPLSVAVFFATLLSGMALYQVGEVAHLSAVNSLGQWIVVLSFVVFLGQFLVLRHARDAVSQRNGGFLALFWFTAFLWIGLGYHALPILWFSYLSEMWIKTMDVYRIWLYLALPMSVLAARGLLRSFTRLWNRTRFLGWILVVLSVTSITIGVALKTNYAFSANVNNVLPYSTANAEIPSRVIDYFRNDPSPGRILGIYVPFWIYVLPNYVDKPIVDGWYPQTKLVTYLVGINDYRLDDLETAPNRTARIGTWRTLIAQAEPLGITWIMIGNRTLANALMMMKSDFTEELSVPYAIPSGTIELIIYKAKRIPSFILTDPPTTDLPTVSRTNPDRIVLKFSPITQATTVLVKEAYFPTWKAVADGESIAVKRDSTSGYILLNVPAGTHQVTLYQERESWQWYLVSLISLAACLAAVFLMIVRNSRQSKGHV